MFKRLHVSVYYRLIIVKNLNLFFIDGRCFMDVFLNGADTCAESTSTNM